MTEIKDIEIFSKLTDDELKELDPYVKEVSFRKRETVFDEGDQPEWFYILKAGKVKITKFSSEGKEIIIEVISPGDMFGGVAVIRGFPYPGSAVAMEDSAAWRISR